MGRVSELAATLEEAEEIKRDFGIKDNETAFDRYEEAFDGLLEGYLSPMQMGHLKVIMNEYFVLKRENIDLKFKVSMGFLPHSINEIAGEKNGN